MGDTVIIQDDKPSDDKVVILDRPKTVVVEEPKKVEQTVVTETHTTKVTEL